VKEWKVGHDLEIGELAKVDPATWRREHPDTLAFDSFSYSCKVKHYNDWQRLHPDVYGVFARVCHMCFIQEKNPGLLDSELHRLTTEDGNVKILGEPRWKVNMERDMEFLKTGQMGTRMNEKVEANVGASRRYYQNTHCYINGKKRELKKREVVLEKLEKILAEYELRRKRLSTNLLS
jgi:hypothetical protein